MSLLNIILFILFSFSQSKDKSFEFTIRIKDGPKSAIFPLKVGNYEVESIYSGLKTKTSEIFFAFTPKSVCDTKIMDKCYNGDSDKNTQKIKKMKFFGEEKEGYVYKDTIEIGGTKLGEIEFLYVEVSTMYPGYINFGYRSIDLLEDNDVISEKIVYYKSFNEINKTMDVIIGKEYKKKTFYDSCKIYDKNSGCILKEIILSDGNLIDKNYFSIELNTIVEFFNSNLFMVEENTLTGNQTAIEKIKTSLIDNGFNCENMECKSSNKSIYFVFGDKGIKIREIYLYPTSHPNLVFGFNTLSDVDVVLDYEDNKVFFMTDEKDIIFEMKKKEKSVFLILLIVLIVLVCALAIFYFYTKYRRKSKLAKLKYNDLIDSLEK